MRPYAIILAGPSGAGKSTIAQAIAEFHGGEVVSVDTYFTAQEGRYVFNLAELPNAHAVCLRKFAKALQEYRSVVVDNTNTTIAEIAPYVAFAQAHGYNVVVLHVDSTESAATLARRNLHGVPKHEIEGQRRRLIASAEQWPSHWPPRIPIVAEQRERINTTWTEENAREAFPLGVPVDMVDGNRAIAVEVKRVQRGHPFPATVFDVIGYVARP